MADVSWLVTPISLMNSARQGTIRIEDSLCAEITRLLGLDQLLVEGHALVLLTKEPLIEVLGNRAIAKIPIFKYCASSLKAITLQPAK